jgi:hypothetical protein
VWGGVQRSSGHIGEARNFWPLPGFKPWTIQPITQSLYQLHYPSSNSASHLQYEFHTKKLFSTVRTRKQHDKEILQEKKVYLSTLYNKKQTPVLYRISKENTYYYIVFHRKRKLVSEELNEDTHYGCYWQDSECTLEMSLMNHNHQKTMATVCPRLEYE